MRLRSLAEGLVHVRRGVLGLTGMDHSATADKWFSKNCAEGLTGSLRFGFALRAADKTKPILLDDNGMAFFAPVEMGSDPQEFGSLSGSSATKRGPMSAAISTILTALLDQGAELVQRQVVEPGYHAAWSKAN